MLLRALGVLLGLLGIVRTAYVGTENSGDVLTKANFDKLPGGWIGYAETTSSQSGISAVTDLTSLSVTVTVGSNRRIRITGQADVTRTVASDLIVGRIKESTTNLGIWYAAATIGTFNVGQAGCVITPTAGSHTYKLTLERSSGTGTCGVNGAAGEPNWILVEDLGPAS